MWPFNHLLAPQVKAIRKAEVAAAEARTRRYEKLFEIDSRMSAHPMDELTRAALKLLEPDKDVP